MVKNMIRIILDKREGEKYTLDVMDTRNGSTFNVTYHESHGAAVVEICEALQKWKEARGVKNKDLPQTKERA